MTFKIITLILPFVASTLFASEALAQKNKQLNNSLSQSFNLVPAHSKDTQYYQMESRVLKYSQDGTRNGYDIYCMTLRCVPAAGSPGKNEYMCVRFTVKLNNSAEVLIPSLTNWKHYLSLENPDNNEYLFGIRHDIFEQLTDEKGKKLPPENAYHVYNAFIDFHSMSVFCEKTDTGKGAQHLRYIGDSVIHSASYSKPPVNLGKQVLAGSYFQNGKIIISFKGLSKINNLPCAIIEYDSGESSFFMNMKTDANMEIKTKGTSHYWGDIYKSLDNGWIQLANLKELVVSETEIIGMNLKVPVTVERAIEIKNISKQIFH